MVSMVTVNMLSIRTYVALPLFFYWISIAIYERAQGTSKTSQNEKEKQEQIKKWTRQSNEEKKPPKIIKPHENSREEHVCNEHFRVLNFLYLRSQSVRCATCAIHSFPYAAIAFIFVNLLHYDDKNLALIDSNNFSLLCSIPYCSAKRTPNKDKEHNLFELCYRLVAEKFLWTKCFR